MEAELFQRFQCRKIKGMPVRGRNFIPAVGEIN